MKIVVGYARIASSSGNDFDACALSATPASNSGYVVSCRAEKALSCARSRSGLPESSNARPTITRPDWRQRESSPRRNSASSLQLGHHVPNTWRMRPLPANFGSASETLPPSTSVKTSFARSTPALLFVKPNGSGSAAASSRFAVQVSCESLPDQKSPLSDPSACTLALNRNACAPSKHENCQQAPFGS